LAPKWRVNTKVDPSRLDPYLKVIISQCDKCRGAFLLTCTLEESCQPYDVNKADGQVEANFFRVLPGTPAQEFFPREFHSGFFSGSFLALLSAQKHQCTAAAVLAK
jgi:hypothetical protein